MNPHLDDETLSAYLDGVGGSADAPTHLAGCPACAARLEHLATASRAVATAPSPLAAARRDAMLEAALGAAAPEVEARTVAEGGARRRSWLVAAAAVVALGVAVPVVGSQLGRGGVEEQLATDTGGSAPEAATEMAQVPPAPGTDLGELDLAALRQGGPALEQLRAQLGGERGDEYDRESGTALDAPALGEGPGQAASEANPAPLGDCEPPVRAERPELGPLTTAASATVDGELVNVLAFTSGEPGSLLAVIVTASCAELAAIALP